MTGIDRHKPCRSRLLTFDEALAYIRSRGVDITEEQFRQAILRDELKAIRFEITEED